MALLAGFGRTVITSETSLPLGGYGNTMKRMSETVLDDLMATCVAVTDEKGETLLLISLDLGNSSDALEIRQQVTEATGIPVDHIMVAATHTHSAPDLYSPYEGTLAWKQEYIPGVAMAAKAALADRSAAEVYFGKTQTKGMNFVRHYLLSDGSYGGDNFGDFKQNTIVDHAAPNDPGMQVIRFVRDGAKDIVMVNWQAHPTVTGGMAKTDMSADFIGSTRRYIEETTGNLFIYFTGAAGNQNYKSRIPDETPTHDNAEYGRLLGAYVLEAQKDMIRLEGSRIKTTQVLFEGQVDHTMDEKLEQAKEVRQLFLSEGRDVGNKLARQYGFSSVYHAGAVVRRSNYDQTRTMEINGYCIGTVSFVAAPYEMFAAHGMYIKAHTPFPMTFVVSCCNGANSYLPTTAAYDYGCYESHNGNFVRGTGGQLAETFVKMLKQLHS